MHHGFSKLGYSHQPYLTYEYVEQHSSMPTTAGGSALPRQVT
jgi:hypothetical protein